MAVYLQDPPCGIAALRLFINISGYIKENNAMGSIDAINSCIGLPSAFVRLFYLFLFIAVSIAIARVIELALQLWAFRRKSTILGGDITDNAEAIAKAVLKNRIEFAAKLSDADKINGPAILFKINCIETRFLYCWERCYAKARSTQTLAGLTLILSFLIAALVCINICSDLAAEENASTLVAAIASWTRQEVFIPLAVGLFFSAIFYVVSRMFESILARRRRSWDYLSARFREEFCSKQQPSDGCLR
jgi:hypothetical protein